MAALYEFVDLASCIDCISWSSNHRIAVCTDASIRILTLECNTENVTPKLKCNQSSIQVNPDALDIPKFSTDEHHMLVHKLPKELQKELIVDKVMNPYKFTQNFVPVTGYCAAAWSPEGTGIKNSCILAALSLDCRLTLYTQRSSIFKWFQVCDLSKMRLNQFPADESLRTPERFLAYRKWCYKHAYAAIVWSPVLHTDKETNKKYAVLAAGTKNGEIVVWKTQVPTDKKSDCKLYKCFHVHHCQVTKLAWSQHSGRLAVGYVDGQVHCIQVNLADSSVEPVSTCIHGESDLLRISAMCFTSVKQPESEVLLVNKEDCIYGFKLDQQHSVISQTHVISESSFYATGMCPMEDNSILMSSLDGVLQKIECDTENRQLKMIVSKANVDVPLTFKKPALCQGVTTSPNKVFAAFAQRPSPGYDHLDPIYKQPTKVHILPISSLDPVPNTISQTDLTQRLIDETDYFGAKLDLLELFRQYCVATDPMGPIDMELQCNRGRGLKLNRLALMLKISQLYYLLNTEPKTDRLTEALDTRVENLLQTTLQVEALHIQTCLDKLCVSGVEASKEKNIKLLSGMKTFLEGNLDKLQHIDVHNTIDQLKNLIGQSTVAMEMNCCICSCKLIRDGLQMKCKNGHMFETCCRTLQPCEGIDYCKCTVCAHLCLSPEQLQEFDWLGDETEFCCLCEGPVTK